MANDISAFGLKVLVLATGTFPIGIEITQFADDADPFDIPSLQIADSAMGINGDLISWSKANPIKITLNVIANSIDDDELAILLEANRVGRGKVGAHDKVTMTAIYPDGHVIVLTNGIITDGMPGSAVSSAGRLKSKNYQFSFENRVGV